VNNLPVAIVPLCTGGLGVIPGTLDHKSSAVPVAPPGAVGRVSDLRSRGHGFDSRPGTWRKNSGQVSHTYVPLSPSSTSWYRPKSGDALWLGSKGRYGLCMGGKQNCVIPCYTRVISEHFEVVHHDKSAI